MNNEWNQLNDRKWELKCQDRVLATIYCKPSTDRFSLYVSSPKIYKSFNEVSVTHIYDTLKEAQDALDHFLTSDVGPWAKAVVEYVSSIINDAD